MTFRFSLALGALICLAGVAFAQEPVKTPRSVRRATADARRGWRTVGDPGFTG